MAVAKRFNPLQMVIDFAFRSSESIQTQVKPTINFSDEWIRSNLGKLKSWWLDNSIGSKEVLTEDWSSNNAESMHSWLLTSSIETLCLTGSEKDKLDVLKWVFAPDVIEKLGKSPDGRSYIIRQHQSDIPFSFLNCCRAAGCADHETFRELLVARIGDDVLRHKVEKYLRLTQGTH